VQKDRCAGTTAPDVDLDTVGTEPRRGFDPVE